MSRRGKIELDFVLPAYLIPTFVKIRRYKELSDVHFFDISKEVVGEIEQQDYVFVAYLLKLYLGI